jgi:hypothetical protein
MSSSGFDSELTFETFNVNGIPQLRRFSPPPITPNACSCATEDTCRNRTQIISDYVCRYGRNCTAGTIIWTVPGLANACNKFDIALLSDLRCVFNQSCIDQLFDYYNVDLPDRLPLPEYVTQAKALDASQLGTFSTKDTLSALAQRLFVVKWELTAEYENYYNACAPLTCNYIINNQIDLLFVIGQVIGYLGLITALRIIVPTVVWALYELCRILWNRGHNNSEGIQLRRFGQMNRLVQRTRDDASLLVGPWLKQSISTLNLFRKESSHCRYDYAHEIAILSTRIYAILFTLNMLILTGLISLGQTTSSVIFQSPSRATFDLLNGAHASTLSCPCTEVFMAYTKFLNISPTFHQVGRNTVSVRIYV